MPDDSHSHVHKLLEEIWLRAMCGNMPVVFSTDNAGKERLNVANSFRAIGRARRLLGLSCEPEGGSDVVVSQDIFHARERIARELKRGHPDYYPAVAHIKKIFAR